MDRLLVAGAIGRTPSSSEFKRLLSSSLRYGLTLGTEKADYISPTDLGLKVAQPQFPEERGVALVEACLKPDLMGRILRHFNKNKLPDRAFLKNMLERTFGVDRTQSEELAGLLIANATYCGILQDISGAQYIRIDDPVQDAPQLPSAASSAAPDEAEVPVVDFAAARDKQEANRSSLAAKEPGRNFCCPRQEA
jgi:hypothetical protein